MARVPGHGEGHGEGHGVRHERWTARDVERFHREPVLFRPITAREAWRRWARRAWRTLTPALWFGVALALATLALGGFLAGCAETGYWRRTHSAMPAVHIEVPADQLQVLCRALDKGRFANYHGCAARDLRAGVCWMYTEPNTAAWIVEHERRHCEGWSHP